MGHRQLPETGRSPLGCSVERHPPDYHALAPGDANMDGVVDEADAATLAGHWGQGGSCWSDGDFNNDGTVNAADASILAANWGHQAEEACSASVPEPLSGALLSAGVVVLLLWTPRRKQAYRTGGTSSRS